MGFVEGHSWDLWRERFPEKFVPVEQIFKGVHPGARIFIGTACGEPQALTRALVEYVRMNPSTLYDAEVVQVWSLGITPYADERFQPHFRLNSFFVGDSTRDAVNTAAADYTPIFLSAIPDMVLSGRMPVDLALVQASTPDGDGRMSLGISVDIVKPVVESASLVAVQSNSQMPFVYGDGILEIGDVDYVVPHDEPLLEYRGQVPGDIAMRIGRYVARIIGDGATIQVGYGSLPDAVLFHLKGKRHLGLHSELFTDGVAELMRLGALDNSRKSIDTGKAVASFCMGSRQTYEFLHRNSSVEFRSIGYTNDMHVISRQCGMTAINSALEIDLTGQSTAESLGGRFYSGVGGQTDFMRAAAIAPGGLSLIHI
ncbi:MAG: acetyl-CoA hydrolase/transferase C-terminal domain-containing protein [Methanothrix sp.]|nr:acetyl-CoA hydrolase/transferase C-terminal domain-containing protein [Methanothrix sp.]